MNEKNDDNVIFIDRYINTFHIDPRGIRKKEDTLESMLRNWANSYVTDICDKIIERANYYSPRISKDTPICLSQKIRKRTVDTLHVYDINIVKLLEKRIQGTPQLRSVKTTVSIAESNTNLRLCVTIQLV